MALIFLSTAELWKVWPKLSRPMDQSLSILILMTVSRPVCNLIFMVGSAIYPTTNLTAHGFQMFSLYSRLTSHTRNYCRLFSESIRSRLLCLIQSTSNRADTDCYASCNSPPLHNRPTDPLVMFPELVLRPCPETRWSHEAQWAKKDRLTLRCHNALVSLTVVP